MRFCAGVILFVDAINGLVFLPVFLSLIGPRNVDLSTKLGEARMERIRQSFVAGGRAPPDVLPVSLACYTSSKDFGIVETPGTSSATGKRRSSLGVTL